ncbi:MAG: prepilin-type N-terminal cleavage/methylation domain-containing protein [Pyrinomonadaceae bacterium]|nr:prepilin-type N-terminal cleavage/methylation domain-containing protein [Pyrinomonadaceae bacterium]
MECRGNTSRKVQGERHPLRLGPHSSDAGYSLIELIVSLVLSLIILGGAVTVFSSALGSRTRETSTGDAVTSAQAALNIVSREVGNAGYGLVTNGIVLTDSTDKKLHIRTNTNNQNALTDGPGEDVTFYYDSNSQSVVRYDSNTGLASGVINRVSDVDFVYHNYASDGTVTTGSAAANTGKITIKLQVILEDIEGQPGGRIVSVNSDVTLRNSPYQLGQY